MNGKAVVSSGFHPSNRPIIKSFTTIGFIKADSKKKTLRFGKDWNSRWMSLMIFGPKEDLTGMV